MAAFKMPKETDEDKAARSAAIQAGYEHAASVPLEIARAAVDLMELAEDATAIGNPQAASDGAVGRGAPLLRRALRDRERGDQRGVAEGRGATRRRCSTRSPRCAGRADQSVRESQTAFQLRLSS